jgi:hypothetical protein
MESCFRLIALRPFRHKRVACVSVWTFAVKQLPVFFQTWQVQLTLLWLEFVVISVFQDDLMKRNLNCACCAWKLDRSCTHLLPSFQSNSYSKKSRIWIWIYTHVLPNFSKVDANPTATCHCDESFGAHALVGRRFEMRTKGQKVGKVTQKCTIFDEKSRIAVQFLGSLIFGGQTIVSQVPNSRFCLFVHFLAFRM